MRVILCKKLFFMHNLVSGLIADDDRHKLEGASCHHHFIEKKNIKITDYYHLK